LTSAHRPRQNKVRRVSGAFETTAKGKRFVKTGGRFPLVFAVTLLFTSSPGSLKIFFQSCTEESFSRAFVYRRIIEETGQQKKSNSENPVNPVFTSVTSVAQTSDDVSPEVFDQGSARRGGALFEQMCAACHTIGGGAALGPDVKGIADKRPGEWLIDFIMNPDPMFENDAVARRLLEQSGIRMPDLNLTRTQTIDILAHIERVSEPLQLARFAGSTQQPVISRSTGAQATIEEQRNSGSSYEGNLYFIGSKNLKNEGPACVGCHSVSSLPFPYGGSLGGELTGVYENLGLEVLHSGLETMPWRVMRPIYAEKPLTDEEIRDLAAFFKEAGGEPAPPDLTFLLALPMAGSGFALSVVIIWAVWRSRIKPVRRNLVRRVKKSLEGAE
jgi:mono/diheme cytochrome c family protein